MRVLIRDAVIVDGTGAPPVEHVSVAIEDHAIDAIFYDPAPSYDPAGVVIDAHGGFVIPGVLNHHAHGMTRGPLMIIGQPALSDERASWNRSRLLREGVTRVLNVDGFAVVEEARAASRFPGLTVMTSTLHTPAHYEWVTEGEFVFGGVLGRHHSTIAEQLEQGSPAIGEIGPGIDTHWIDHTILPYVVNRAGGKINASTGRQLRVAVESGRTDEVVTLLNGSGAAIGAEQLADLLEQGRSWCNRALVACEEALDIAADLDVPVIMHHTPPTYEIVLSAAEKLGPRLICAHSNFAIDDPQLAVEHAQELRRLGARVDVMTGDATGARAFLPSDEVTHAMFRAGCVDLISTDYVGGYWESMLQVVDRAVAADALQVEDGVRMLTGQVSDALPRFAPHRGTLEVGKVADVVVTKPGALSQVEAILISGVPVELNGASANHR